MFHKTTQKKNSLWLLSFQWYYLIRGSCNFTIWLSTCSKEFYQVYFTKDNKDIGYIRGKSWSNYRTKNEQEFQPVNLSQRSDNIIFNT